MEDRTIFWIGAVLVILLAIWYFATPREVDQTYLTITAKNKAGDQLWTTQVPITSDMTQSVAGSPIDISQCGKEITCMLEGAK